MYTPECFNPLDYQSLSKSIADALMRAELIDLADLEPFNGPGVYALFYDGEFEAYNLLGERNRLEAGSWPIYIGKAAPSTRKGKDIDPDDFAGRDLYNRVRKHAQSITEAENLDIKDFAVKLLLLSYIWVPLAETAMIGQYTPLWNTIIDGFGNHDPGSGRINGKRSRWDTLHPGRPWAAKYPTRNEGEADIKQEARAFLQQSLFGLPYGIA